MPAQPSLLSTTKHRPREHKHTHKHKQPYSIYLNHPAIYLSMCWHTRDAVHMYTHASARFAVFASVSPSPLPFARVHDDSFYLISNFPTFHLSHKPHTHTGTQHTRIISTPPPNHHHKQKPSVAKAPPISPWLMPYGMLMYYIHLFSMLYILIRPEHQQNTINHQPTHTPTYTHTQFNPFFALFPDAP